MQEHQERKSTFYSETVVYECFCLIVIWSIQSNSVCIYCFWSCQTRHGIIAQTVFNLSLSISLSFWLSLCLSQALSTLSALSIALSLSNLSLLLSPSVSSLSLTLSSCGSPSKTLWTCCEIEFSTPVCTGSSQASHCQSTQLAPKAEAKMFSNSKCILHFAELALISIAPLLHLMRSDSSLLRLRTKREKAAQNLTICVSSRS